MKDSVTALLCFEGRICVIERACHLTSFPGYHSFPGGKIDEEDKRMLELPKKLEDVFSEIPRAHFWALSREVKEELGIDFAVEKVSGATFLGEAETPAFNPYRFKNYFYLIELSMLPSFTPDVGEIARVFWQTPLEFLNDFLSGDVLAVPPTIMVMQELAKRSEMNVGQVLCYRLDYVEASQIPCIESVSGIKQYLPLTNTFPPAMRTNSFLIGDAGKARVLIDPSAKNKNELAKFLKSLESEAVDVVFITHHHPDHHEFAVEIAKAKQATLKISLDSFERIQKKWGQSYFKDLKVETVQEGDIVTTWLGEEVALISIPGHDRGLLGLYPKSLKWMIVSDLIQTIGTVVVGDEEGDMREYFDSLEKVIQMKPRFIFPSHGIAIGGISKLQETLDHRKFRERQIIELLEKKQTFEQIVSEIYPDLPHRLLSYARLTVQAHLDKIKTDKKKV